MRIWMCGLGSICLHHSKVSDNKSRHVLSSVSFNIQFYCFFLAPPSIHDSLQTYPFFGLWSYNCVLSAFVGFIVHRYCMYKMNSFFFIHCAIRFECNSVFLFTMIRPFNFLFDGKQKLLMFFCWVDRFVGLYATAH